jgi:hypothetical protein
MARSNQTEFWSAVSPLRFATALPKIRDACLVAPHAIFNPKTEIGNGPMAVSDVTFRIQKPLGRPNEKSDKKEVFLKCILRDVSKPIFRK